MNQILAFKESRVHQSWLPRHVRFACALDRARVNALTGAFTLRRELLYETGLQAESMSFHHVEFITDTHTHTYTQTHTHYPGRNLKAIHDWILRDYYGQAGLVLGSGEPKMKKTGRSWSSMKNRGVCLSPCSVSHVVPNKGLWEHGRGSR